MPIELYSLSGTPTPGEYIIQKFDTDYHCESVYALTASTCMCPQGHKETCRHRKMLGDFLKHGHIGDGWFMEWQTRLWRRPVGDSAEFLEGMTQTVKSTFTCHTDGTVSCSSDTEAATRPSAGEPSAAPAALAPPPPPEGPTSLSPGAATASPVGAVATIKRRKV